MLQMSIGARGVGRRIMPAVGDYLTRATARHVP